jgi:hypothetical protein
VDAGAQTKPAPALSLSKRPALSLSKRPALSLSKRPALSLSKRPALGLSKRPALGLSKGPALSERSEPKGYALSTPVMRRIALTKVFQVFRWLARTLRPSAVSR